MINGLRWYERPSLGERVMKFFSLDAAPAFVMMGLLLLPFILVEALARAIAQSRGHK